VSTSQTTMIIFVEGGQGKETSKLIMNRGSGHFEKLVYLIQGIVAPPYEGIDLGVGEKFALAVIFSAIIPFRKSVLDRIPTLNMGVIE